MNNTIYLVVLLYTFYRGMRGNLRIISSFKKLNKLYLNVIQNGNTDEKNVQNTNFTILIPVLREQEIVNKAISKISQIKGEFKLYFVTTEREYAEKILQKQKLIDLKEQILALSSEEQAISLLSGILPLSTSIEAYNLIKGQSDNWLVVCKLFDDLPFTKEIIQQQIEKLSLQNKVGIIHYPHAKGNKTEQLNYAIKEIEKNKNGIEEFLLFYDADSEIHPNIIIDLQKYLAYFPEANVIQQSALFLSNYQELIGTWQKPFLQAIALLQSRWTLAHELPRIFTQFESKLGNYLEASHLVAHGLFIRMSALQKVGYFPVNFITEDLPLGYLIRLSGEKIYPFPVLESSQSPVTIKSMFAMYESWFLGVVGYFKCSLFSLSKKEVPKIRAVIWGSTCFIRGIMWFMLSFVWIYLFIYPILNLNFILFILACVSFIIYAPLSFFLLKREFNRNCHLIAQEKQDLEINFLTHLFALPAYLTHSYGPLTATCKLIVNFLTGQEIKRNKTER